MKKTIIILMVIGMCLSLFACNPNKDNTTPSPKETILPNETPKETEQVTEPTPYIDVTNSPVVFNSEDVNLKTILPELKTKEFEYRGDKVYFLQSPFSLNEQEIMEKLKNTQFGKNLTFTTHYREWGEGNAFDAPNNSGFVKQCGEITIVGYASDAQSIYDTSLEVSISTDTSETIGNHRIRVEMTDIGNIPPTDLQTMAKEILMAMFDESMAHSIIYAPSIDVSDYQYRLLEYIENTDEYDNTNKYTITRGIYLKGNNKPLDLEIGVYLDTDAHNWANGYDIGYESIATDFPIDIPSIFNGRLGDVFSIADNKGTFDKFFKLEEAQPYICSRLYDYEYQKDTSYDGTTVYKINTDFCKHADELHPLMASHFYSEYTFTVGANQTIQDCRVKIQGTTDHEFYPYGQPLTNETTLQIFNKLFPLVIEQIKMAFDDKVNVDNLTLDNFEPLYDPNNILGCLTYSLPASITIEGNTYDGTLNIKMLSGLNDSLAGSWTFTY